MTIFQQGDFLSLHDDRGLGKYAFTISLSSLAEDEGGWLRVYDASTGESDRCLLSELRPQADELVNFALCPEPLT